MKWLLIGLLALTVLISGCDRNRIGWKCSTCEREMPKPRLLAHIAEADCHLFRWVQTTENLNPNPNLSHPRIFLYMGGY